MNVPPSYPPNSLGPTDTPLPNPPTESANDVLGCQISLVAGCEWVSAPPALLMAATSAVPITNLFTRSGVLLEPSHRTHPLGGTSLNVPPGRGINELVGW